MIWMLLVAALCLFFFEFFVPGGILGSIGLLLLSWSIYLYSQEHGLLGGSFYALGSLLLIGLLFYLTFMSPLSRLWILRDQLDHSSPPSTLSIGMLGVAATTLRPSGKAIFVIDGRERRFDVLTQGDFIEKDQAVRVEGIQGLNVLVGKA